MDRYVIIKKTIKTKFDEFMDHGRILYFGAPCGFGKSTVAFELLRGKKFELISGLETDGILPEIKLNRDIVVIDDLQQFQEDEDLQKLNELIRDNPQKKFVLLSRGGDGGEFGATTGRPRRMGWFDAVATRYGVRMQGTTEVALTVVDVLGYLDEIPMCVGYEIDGKVTKDFPTTSELEKAKPVLKTLPGWKCDIRGIKNYEDLPKECRDYVEAIEKEIEAPITMVSNGPGRHEIIHRVSSYSK